MSPYRLFLVLMLLLASANGLAEPLRVALSPDYMPIAFKQDGKLVGIEVDNAREVGKILGREVVFVEMANTDYVEALNEGRVDVVMSEREALVAFANPFMEVGQMGIILAERAGSLAHPRAMYRPGLRIGVEPGTTGERYVRQTYPEAIVLTYPDPSSAFAALRAAAADVYVHDAPTSWNLASSREDQDMLSPGGTSAEWPPGRDTELLDSGYRAGPLKSLRTGRRDARPEIGG